jgi:hypothetical protein
MPSGQNVESGSVARMRGNGLRVAVSGVERVGVTEAAGADTDADGAGVVWHPDTTSVPAATTNACNEE